MVLHIIIFAVLLVVSFGWFGMNVKKIRDNILMGRDVNRSDQKGKRWKVMTLIALGQKKMFKRPLPAFLHLCIYAAFVITQIELIEIIADGLSGSHRTFRPALGGFYSFMISFIEILSVFAFFATLIFLSRRNIVKTPRLTMSEMKGWPKLDGNLILIMELMLICFIFMMNGADEVLYREGLSHTQNLGDGTLNFTISQFIGPALFSGMNEASLHLLERIGWWGHVIVVFGFLNYLPYSKHFHILLAFPNTFYSKLVPKGQFTNLENVKKEVELMMDPDADPYAVPEESETEEEPGRFGALDVEDLTWKQLLSAYTCTECGRCTSVCPANQTGKLLSPRKIMMDTRDRMEDKRKGVRINGKDYDDGKTLAHDYITEEELWACTTCNACVEACPVNIDPMSIIVELRRGLVMEQSKIPTELATMNSNIENNGAPWQFSQEDRLKWVDED